MNKLFHFHIRKTSGTVLYEALVEEVGKENVFPYRSDIELFEKLSSDEQVREELAQYNVVSGHLYMAASLVEGPCDFVTILRNPLKRCVSAYNHMKFDTLDPKHQEIADLSFSEALDSHLFKEELWNGMTRALVKGAGADFETLDDVARIETALSFLRRMKLVGFQESLPAFYSALKEAYGLPVSYEKRVNSKVTEGGISSKDVYSDMGRMMMRNWLDVAVYFEALSFGEL